MRYFIKFYYVLIVFIPIIIDIIIHFIKIKRLNNESKKMLYFYRIYKHYYPKIKFSEICFLNNFVKDKLRNNNKLVRNIFYLTVLNCIFNIYFNSNESIIKWSLTILVGLASLLVSYNLLLIYRHEKGYFGTNYEEAKELLYYIKQTNNNHNNFNGKKVFNELVDKENIAESLWELLKE